MKLELYDAHRVFGALVAVAASLVLFAGGNRAGAASRMPGGARPTTTGTPQPYPLSNGDAFIYADTFTGTTTYPSATPSSTSYTSTESSVYECPVTFNEVANLCAELGADSQGDVLDGFQGYVPGGSAQVNTYGLADIYFDGLYTQNYELTYDPYQVFAVFPVARGERFNDADNTSREDAVTTGPSRYRQVTTGAMHPDGSYRYVTKTTEPTQSLTSRETSLVRSDASAEYQATQTGYNPLTQTFGTPISVSGQEVIPVTTEGGNQLPATPPPPVTVNVPDWFPGGGAPPRRLYSQPTRVVGTVTVPAECGAYAGTKAVDLRGTYIGLDPLEGWVLTGSQDTYFPQGLGAGACYITSYSYAYYDNLNTGQLLYTGSAITSSVLTDQYLPDLRRRGTGWPEAISQLLPRMPSNGGVGQHGAGIDRFHAFGLRGLRRNGRQMHAPGARFAEVRSIMRSQ